MATSFTSPPPIISNVTLIPRRRKFKDSNIDIILKASVMECDFSNVAGCGP